MAICPLPLPPSDPAAPASPSPPISKLTHSEQKTPAARQVSDWKTKETPLHLLGIRIVVFPPVVKNNLCTVWHVCQGFLRYLQLCNRLFSRYVRLETNFINNGSVPGCSRSPRYPACTIPETSSAKWNALIFSVSSYMCAFPAVVYSALSALFIHQHFATLKCQ